MGGKQRLSSKGWQNFLLCIFLHLCIPLLPLLIEFWATADISDKTLTLAGTVYTIAVGVTSRNKALLGLAFLLSVILAVAFGFAASANDPLPGGGYVSGIAILVMFAFHAFERYNRHVAEGSSFFQFDVEED